MPDYYTLQVRNPTTTMHNAIYLGVSYQRDSANKTNLFKPEVGLSASVIKIVRPIYMALMNQNESFNSMIWERVPKITYVGKDILDFAVYDAAANFNDERQGTIDLFKQLNIHPGYYYTTIRYYQLLYVK